MTVLFLSVPIKNSWSTLCYYCIDQKKPPAIRSDDKQLSKQFIRQDVVYYLLMKNAEQNVKAQI